MTLKKTTKVLFSQLPKGTSSATLKRPSGTAIRDIDILTLSEDMVREPYLPYILSQLDLLKRITIVNEGGMPTTVYTVKAVNCNDLDINKVSQIVKENVSPGNDDIVPEIIQTIFGIQYVLRCKRQFGVDVVRIEGNSPGEIVADKNEGKSYRKPL